MKTNKLFIFFISLFILPLSVFAGNYYYTGTDCRPYHVPTSNEEVLIYINTGVPHKIISITFSIYNMGNVDEFSVVDDVTNGKTYFSGDGYATDSSFPGHTGTLYAFNTSGKIKIRYKRMGSGSPAPEIYINSTVDNNSFTSLAVSGIGRFLSKAYIGNYTPHSYNATLNVTGHTLLRGNTYLTSFVGIGMTPNTSYRLAVSGNSYFNGNVGIGTAPNSSYKLSIKGSIKVTEIFVLPIGEFPDYVFSKDYKLRELNEVKDFIQENGHLPDIPSAGEVKENGIPVGDLQTKLLLKIEELTLYTIQQKELIDKLEKRIVELENNK